MNATKEFKRLEGTLEEITNTDPQNLEGMQPGDEWCQGDLRIIRLPDGFCEENADQLRDAKAAAQLAPGTSKGARHCLSRTDGISFYSLIEENELDGPIIHAKESFEIAHPEHGDCCNLPPGCYAFPGQRTYAEELRRVAD